jgi:Uma2 family endonuclease
MHINLRQLVVPSGHQVLLKDISWQDFEKIMEELGGQRNVPRISYSEGYLELMSPLAVHEFDKEIINDLVKIILEELNIEFNALGSMTLKSSKVHEAVEADGCFYIQHERAVRGKDRIYLESDPPPDLAIEIDITSRTHFDNYEKLGIPELWRFDGKELHVFVLQQGIYQGSDVSLQFPQFEIKQLIPNYIEKAKTEGRNKAMKAFRHYVQQHCRL